MQEPALSEVERMGHPPWEWCNAKMGHPPTSLFALHRELE